MFGFVVKWKDPRVGMKTILVTDHDYTFISFVSAFPTRNQIAIKLQPKNFSKILLVLLLR